MNLEPSVLPVEEPLILDPGPSPRGWHRLQLAAECLSKYAHTFRPGEPLQPAQTVSLIDGELYVDEDENLVQADEFTTSPALVKGSLFHLALAQHYMRIKEEQTGGNPEKWATPEAALQRASIQKGPVAQQVLPEIMRAYRAYARQYLADAYNMSVVGVEELGETLIAGKYRLTGRMDLIYKDASGKIFVVDHKTSGRITPKHKIFYSVSGQLLGYSRMASEKYGDQYGGFILNLIQLGDSPSFTRMQLPRSPNLERQFEDRVKDIEESIDRMVAERRHYTEWPKAMSELTCVTRYGECKFLDRCRFGQGAMTAGNFKFQF